MNHATTQAILEVLAALIEQLAARGIIGPADIMELAEIAERHHSAASDSGGKKSFG